MKNARAGNARYGLVFSLFILHSSFPSAHCFHHADPIRHARNAALVIQAGLFHGAGNEANDGIQVAENGIGYAPADIRPAFANLLRSPASSSTRSFSSRRRPGRIGGSELAKASPRPVSFSSFGDHRRRLPAGGDPRPAIRNRQASCCTAQVSITFRVGEIVSSRPAALPVNPSSLRMLDDHLLKDRFKLGDLPGHSASTAQLAAGDIRRV